MSLGRNSLGLLRRLRRRPNVRLVQPYTSSHDLIRGSVGVVVIRRPSAWRRCSTTSRC